LNRLTLINFPSDVDTAYTYDTCVNGKGRLCAMTDASGTTTYEYTPKGQVKKETKIIDSVQYVTQYTYDQNGNVTTMTYPSGKVITYTYANDRATSVLNGAATIAQNIAYKAFGGVSAVTYGNGLSGTMSYDNQYRVTGITAAGVMNQSYPTYDANGNIMAINNALEATKNKSFTYDALDRLSTATSAGIWGSLTWSYDGVGNRLTENANTYTYAPNTNKLTAANGISFGYDNNGNTTSEASRIYTYNQNQRLIQVVDGAMTANYAYNGNGQRVKKNVNGTITIFHYSLNGQIIAESNSAGNITAEYVYLNGQPLAKMEGANTYYYHNDHLGTPQKMTDASGTVVWAADYKPFGEATITVSMITNNLRFPGQYYDAETGLLYNLNRDYNSMIGRCVQADPIGISGGINLYTYADDNPLVNVDPLGLKVQLCARQAFAGNWGKKHKLYLIPHCYIVTDSNIYSWNIAAGSGIHGNESPENNSCSVIKCSCGDSAAFEKCVNEEAAAAKGNEGNIWVPALNDCCTWANRIVGRCKQKHCKN
jgi:RHS repeat-associated protein